MCIVCDYSWLPLVLSPDWTGLDWARLDQTRLAELDQSGLAGLDWSGLASLDWTELAGLDRSGLAGLNWKATNIKKWNSVVLFFF